MIKKNIKGFTLLELLIVIFILTAIIFIGYRIINESAVSVKDQTNISKGQLTMNDMNQYLTKDLEQAASIRLLLDGEEIADTIIEEEKNALSEKIDDIKNAVSINNSVSYTYEIRFKNDSKTSYSTKYNILISKIDQKYRYTVSREEESGSIIEFVSEEILNAGNLPLTIEGNNPYKVILGYSDKNNELNKYEFSIASRLYEMIAENTINPEPEPPKVEEIVPPPNWGEYYVLGFWTADNERKIKNNLYTWVSSYGTILGEAYADQDKTKVEKFNIEGYARPGNNNDTGSYIGYSTIDNDITWKGQVKNVNIGDKDISKISIYISPHTNLENFEIITTQGNATVQVPELKTGWNHCTINKNGNSKVNFKVKGKLSIDKSQVSSGYAYIVYERADSAFATGDIVYNWETQGNKYGVEAYATVGSDTTKRNEYQANENRNMSIQIDKGSHPPVIRARGLDSEIATTDTTFSNIKAIKISIEGKLILKDITFNGIKQPNLNNGNPSIMIPLDNNKSNSLEANFNFSNMKNNKDSGKLIINLVY